MTDETEKKPERKPCGGELLIPVAAALFTVYYFTTITEVPFNAQASALFVGTILLLLCVAFFIRIRVGVRRGDLSLRVGALIEPVSFVPKRLILLGLTVAYIFVVGWLGFTLTTFLFLALSMTVLNDGKRKGFIAALSAVLAVAGWLLFVVAFETRFPAGPFEQLMQKVL
jgi:hypothetical protein